MSRPSTIVDCRHVAVDAVCLSCKNKEGTCVCGIACLMGQGVYDYCCKCSVRQFRNLFSGTEKKGTWYTNTQRDSPLHTREGKRMGTRARLIGSRSTQQCPTKEEIDSRHTSAVPKTPCCPPPPSPCVFETDSGIGAGVCIMFDAMPMAPGLSQYCIIDFESKSRRKKLKTIQLTCLAQRKGGSGGFWGISSFRSRPAHSNIQTATRVWSLHVLR